MVYGYDQQLQKVIAYLKDDLLGIDFFSISKISGGKEEVAAPLGRQAFRLASGDALMLGGDARLAFHGVDRIICGTSTLLPDGGRINLTLRRVNRPA